jgi:conflict system STAND superfamily ATPase
MRRAYISDHLGNRASGRRRVVVFTLHPWARWNVLKTAVQAAALLRQETARARHFAPPQPASRTEWRCSSRRRRCNADLAGTLRPARPIARDGPRWREAGSNRRSRRKGRRRPGRPAVARDLAAPRRHGRVLDSTQADSFAGAGPGVRIRFAPPASLVPAIPNRSISIVGPVSAAGCSSVSADSPDNHLRPTSGSVRSLTSRARRCASASPVVSAAMAPLAEGGDETPYPGLRTFRRDESHLFFGRRSCVNDMIDRLAQTRFLSVVGSSGTGKSSLVKTGLIDGLELGFMGRAGPRWCIVELRPGRTPLRNLARARRNTKIGERGWPGHGRRDRRHAPSRQVPAPRRDRMVPRRPRAATHQPAAGVRCARAGTGGRITGQLIEAESGAHLWPDRFDGSLEDVFDLQNTVATAVAGVIEPKLRVAATERSRRGDPTAQACVNEA